MHYINHPLLKRIDLPQVDCENAAKASDSQDDETEKGTNHLPSNLTETGFEKVYKTKFDMHELSH